MRHHFNRCRNLQVVTVDVSDLSGARRGATAIVDELCAASKLAPCLGLADCEVLASTQKRELLATAAWRLRAEGGGASALADEADPRAAELEGLRQELARDRDLLAVNLSAVPAPPQPDELDRADLRRLEALEAALRDLDHGVYGRCARCGEAIAVTRLRRSPEARVCDACACTGLERPR